MTDYELSMIYGGYVNISPNVINSLVRLVTLAYELGRKLGSSIRRGKEKKHC